MLYGKTEKWWRALLTGDNPALPFRQFRRLFGLLPAPPRCKFCHAPYRSWGGALMRLIGKSPSRLTPELCLQCEGFAKHTMGGAEIELTMLFADVRGSTVLAEQMSPSEYSRLISRLFATSTDILVRTHSWVDRLVGDQVIGLYVPGFAGPEHARLAVRAAQELLQDTEHGEEGGRWIGVGVGIHTDTAFVGAVGKAGGATDITVLGDAPNVAARLSSAAAAGEILVSEPAVAAAGLDPAHLEQRQLELKGKAHPVTVYVLKESSLGVA